MNKDVKINLDRYEETLVLLFRDFARSDLMRTHLTHILEFTKNEDHQSEQYVRNFYLSDPNLRELHNVTPEFTKEHILSLLKDEYNLDILEENLRSGEFVTFRVAGGWVRDKLLGLDSDDIDFAVDITKGLTVAILLLRWLEDYRRNNNSSEYQPTPNNRPIKIGETKIMAINADIEANKLIAPAKIPEHCLERELDFVNLRGEEYELISRRPKVVFGTPKIDAERRDLTINAIFFNVNTGQVEDWLDRGVPDLLVDKIIDTPLDPQTTFEDDPLRIFRAIRFSAKLGYDLSPRLVQLLQNPAQTVAHSLMLKVKRERFSKELAKIYEMRYRSKAYHYILNSKLLQHVLFNLKDLSELNVKEKKQEYIKFFTMKETGRLKPEDDPQTYYFIYEKISEKIDQGQLTSFVNKHHSNVEALLANANIKLNYNIIAFQSCVVTVLLHDLYEKSVNQYKYQIIYQIVYQNVPINAEYVKYVYMIFTLFKIINHIVSEPRAEKEIIRFLVFGFDSLVSHTGLPNISIEIKKVLWDVSRYLYHQLNDVDNKMTDLLDDINIMSVIKIWHSIAIDKYDLLGGERPIKGSYSKKFIELCNDRILDRKLSGKLLTNFRYFIFYKVYQETDGSFKEFQRKFLDHPHRLNFDDEIDVWIMDFLEHYQEELVCVVNFP